MIAKINKRIFSIFTIMLLLVVIVILIFIFRKNNYNKSLLEQEKISNIDVVNDTNKVESEKEMELYLKINDTILSATLEDNSSARAFVEKLQKEDVTINMNDYGNFEKVGLLGFDLPRNDEQIITKAGDIILYQGNSITIYYDTNTWNFTKIGEIENISKETLKEILGKDDVSVTFTLNND